MICDVLVAHVDRGHLSTILPTVHQHALGHVSRVLDAARGGLASQLRRAGVPVEQAPALAVDTPLVLMIAAAARCPAAAHLLMQVGIERVWIVRTSGVWSEVDDTVEILIPAITHRAGRVPHVPVPGISDPAADRIA